MLNQFTVEISTLPVDQCHFHLIQFLEECSAVQQECRAAEGPPSIWDTHGFSGNVFANPVASSSAPYPLELNPWSSFVSEHTSPPVMSESQTQDQD